MGRRIKKNLILIIILATGLAFSGLIIVISACSVGMLDYIEEKIALDENSELLSHIPYRNMVSVSGVTDGTYTQTNGTESFVHNISDFSIAKYEVTYELWYTVHTWAISRGYIFANPGIEGNDGTETDPAGAVPTAAKYEPITTINWRDTIVWCNAYSKMSGYSPVYYTDAAYTAPLETSTNNGTFNTTPGSEDNPYVNWSANGYRLPKEGEWQYAASNKGNTPWNHASGDISSYCYPADVGTSTVFGNYAWYSGNSDTGSGLQTQNVGTKNENQLVIYDMSGNVFEWCWDWFGSYPGDSTDYTGLSSGSYRVIRGGRYDGGALRLQLGQRGISNPDYEYSDMGFRLARGQ
jgi:formylglycine-generating enzyme required for sulfatase activity